MLSQLVVLSLEPWDDVWRRNQLLVEALTNARPPELRVLFVEPPIAALRNFERGSTTSAPRAATVVGHSPRHCAANRAVDSAALVATGCAAFGALGRAGGFSSRIRRTRAVDQQPLARALRASRTGWPVVYDVTDDWLLADVSPAKRRACRLDDELLLRSADAVVVCSPALGVLSRRAPRSDR